MSNQPRAQWSSYPSYLLVTTGAVVGLGNIFQFPMLVSKYGGLFILFYVLCELCISIPVLFSEFLIGRRGKQNPVGAISILSMEAGASLHWRMTGWLCFIILIFTLGYYAVSVAFPLDYFGEAVKAIVSQKDVIQHSDVTSNFPQLEICFLVFLFATMLVVVRGINRGLEGISRITVPFYSILLLALAIYACVKGNCLGAIEYLFASGSTSTLLQIIFAALTFAFFKLGVGMGIMMVYGSYLPYSVTLGKSTSIIVCFDAVISLLSYFIIYPLLLSLPHGLMPVSLASYSNVMAVFLAVPHGVLIAGLFFMAAIIAAWTPTIAMAESASVTLIERFNISRPAGTVIVCVCAIIIGTVIALSYNQWSTITLFNHWTIRNVIQGFTSNILTPLAALLIAIFTGWVVHRQTTFNELGFKEVVYKSWLFLIRFVVPFAIVVVGIVGVL